MGLYSVLDFGAGAGQADQDTAAFKAALAAAKSTNGTVVVPEGTYYINDTLSMTGKVSLLGLVGGSVASLENRSRVVLQMVGSAFATSEVPTDVAANGAALAAYVNEGQQGQRPLQRALLELEGGCAAAGFTVHGLGDAVPNAAIALMGNSTGVRLTNLHLRNVWIGIFSHDSLGRSVMEDCLITEVQRTGICCGAYGGGSFDVSRMARIEVQAASGVKNTTTSVGMVLGHFDGHEVSDCTVRGFYTGIQLKRALSYASTQTSSLISFVDCQVQNSFFALQSITTSANYSWVGGVLQGDVRALDVWDARSVVVQGAVLKSQSDAAVYVRSNAANVAVSNCTVECAAAFAVSFNSSGALVVSECVMAPGADRMVPPPDATSAVAFVQVGGSGSVVGYSNVVNV
jgi:Pectate lyase superfamily protein